VGLLHFSKEVSRERAGRATGALSRWVCQFVCGGRRLVPLLTFDHHNSARQPRIDNAMVKAIARAEGVILETNILQVMRRTW
jgi:hypothetical protein